MKNYPAKKIVQKRTLQKFQNSTQTLIILWLVYPIHTNSLFYVKFEELPFCHFPPLNASILVKTRKKNYTLSQSTHVSAMAYSPKESGNEWKNDGGGRKVISDNCEDLAKMQVSQPNNVKIYNLSAGKSLPEVWTKDYRYMSFIFSKRI